MTSYLAAYGTIARAADEAVTEVMGLKAKVRGRCFGPDKDLQEEVRRQYEKEVGERLHLISRLIVELGSNRPARFGTALSRLWLNLSDISEQAIDLLYFPGYRNLQKVVVAQLDHIQRSLTHFLKTITRKEDPTTFNVNYLLRDIALVACPRRAGFSPAGDERTVSLEIVEKLDEGVPHMVGEPEAVYLALYQIADNSVTATLGDEGRVSLYSKYYERFRQLQVTVADNGEGIDRTGLLRSALEEDLIDTKRAVELRSDETDHNNPLFDLMYLPRVSVFSSRDKRHKGIGMVLARDVISRHGGRVEINSKPGRGTTFQIYFNLR